jgi:hypothetical protein
MRWRSGASAVPAGAGESEARASRLLSGFRIADFLYDTIFSALLLFVMPDLKSTIEELASEFAMSIISALRGASIDELTAVSGAGGRRPASARRAAPAATRAQPEARSASGGRANGKRGRVGRLGRRSAADIGRMIDDIVALVEKHPEGLRAEQIRASLDCQAKELPRPLADALEAGRLSKSGQKRATTYFAAGAAPANGATKRRGARGGRRSKRG